ncbi:MAG: cobalt ECF transporter T component CbiQ [Candidatus Omnitrophota bacterium]
MKRKNFIERSLTDGFSFVRDSLFSDEYASRKGYLQARDPRLKTVGLLCLLLAVLFSKDIFILVVLYAVCLFLARGSSISIGFFLKRTWIFIPLFSFCIAVPVLFDAFSPGEPLAAFRFFSLTLTVTKQGAGSAAFFLTRVVTSVSLCALLVLTTKQGAVLAVLRSFGIPQIFVMTMGMCRRYVYLFIEILLNTFLAVKSRGGHIASVRKGQGFVSWHIAGLWQRSYQLQGQVYQAMLSRGYTGEPRVFSEGKAAAKDWFFLGGAIAVFAMIVWKR